MFPIPCKKYQSGDFLAFMKLNSRFILVKFVFMKQFSSMNQTHCYSLQGSWRATFTMTINQATFTSTSSTPAPQVVPFPQQQLLQDGSQPQTLLAQALAHIPETWYTCHIGEWCSKESHMTPKPLTSSQLDFHFKSIISLMFAFSLDTFLHTGYTKMVGFWLYFYIKLFKNPPYGSKAIEILIFSTTYS